MKKEFGYLEKYDWSGRGATAKPRFGGIVLLIVLLGLFGYAAYYYGQRASWWQKAMPPVESRHDSVAPVTPVVKELAFGTSTKGRAVKGYELGTGADVILMIGTIHGNEMGTASLLKQLVLEVALNPSLVSAGKKIVVIPVMNPDGYEERGDNLNDRGVNLNLNFATADWQAYGPEGNYAGEAPFSEAESQVLRQVVEIYRPSAMISFHSHGKLVSPEADEASQAMAHRYSNLTGYEYFDGWDYPGTATKWFEESTLKPAITVEISKDLQNDWDLNKQALLEIIGNGL